MKYSFRVSGIDDKKDCWLGQVSQEVMMEIFRDFKERCDSITSCKKIMDVKWNDYRICSQVIPPAVIREVKLCINQSESA